MRLSTMYMNPYETGDVIPTSASWIVLPTR